MQLNRIKPRLSTVQLGQTRKRTGNAGERKHFYDSALWKRTRVAKLRRDPLCQRCAYLNLVVQGLHVDHWMPLSQGGHPTADDNLVTLCHSHHSEKTVAEMTCSAFQPIVPSAQRTIALA